MCLLLQGNNTEAVRIIDEVHHSGFHGTGCKYITHGGQFPLGYPNHRIW